MRERIVPPPQVSPSKPPPLGAVDTLHTLFIRNVPGVWAPERAAELIRAHFAECGGAVVDVRLPRHANGALRGLGYVQARAGWGGTGTGGAEAIMANSNHDAMFNSH
jgi:hypothetical protein